MTSREDLMYIYVNVFFFIFTVIMKEGTTFITPVHGLSTASSLWVHTRIAGGALKNPCAQSTPQATKYHQSK